MAAGMIMRIWWEMCLRDENIDDMLSKQLQDEEFRKEYEGWGENLG